MIYTSFLLGLIASASIAFSGASLVAPTSVLADSQPEMAIKDGNIFDVPFYSQFKDIQSPAWQKLGCGITSLAMLIDFYRPGTVKVNGLLKEGIADGAYVNGAGWSHQGLASLANNYGLESAVYDLSDLDANSAFARFADLLKSGPAIASVHYKLDPKNPIPHLVVINGIAGDTIYYNDPAGKSAGKEISVADFIKAWKKRFILVRPGKIQ